MARKNSGLTVLQGHGILGSRCYKDTNSGLTVLQGSKFAPTVFYHALKDLLVLILVTVDVTVGDV